MQLAILAAARREHVTEETCREVDERGAARAIDGTRTLYYSAPNGWAAPKVPNGWHVNQWEGPLGGGRDFRRMIGELDPTVDALCLEDDVHPCTNAIAAIRRVAVPADCCAVSFYDFDSAGGMGIVKIRPVGGKFNGAQALKFPAWMVRRMQAGEFDPPNNAQDCWVGQIAERMKLAIGVYYPSLFQHVGRDSLCNPGATLDGLRAPARTYPGEDYDALGVERVCGQGPARVVGRVTWCSFHGCNHSDPTVCPLVLP